MTTPAKTYPAALRELTIPQAAAHLGVRPGELWAWQCAGRAPAGVPGADGILWGRQPVTVHTDLPALDTLTTPLATPAVTTTAAVAAVLLVVVAAVAGATGSAPAAGPSPARMPARAHSRRGRGGWTPS